MKARSTPASFPTVTVKWAISSTVSQLIMRVRKPKDEYKSVCSTGKTPREHLDVLL